MQERREITLEPIDENRSRILFDGRHTGAVVTGTFREETRETCWGYLVITSFDVPFEELLYFYLFDRNWKRLDMCTLGHWWGLALLDVIRVPDEHTLHFTFESPDKFWELKILPQPRWLHPLRRSLHMRWAPLRMLSRHYFTLESKPILVASGSKRTLAYFQRMRLGFWAMPALFVFGFSSLFVFFIESLPWLVRGTIAAAALALAALLRPHGLRLFEPVEEKGVIDNDSVRVYTGPRAKLLEQVRWADLTEVAFMRPHTDAPPQERFWILRGAGGATCAITDDEGETIGLELRLSKLPGFDQSFRERIAREPGWAEFVCWRGAPGDGFAAAG